MLCRYLSILAAAFFILSGCSSTIKLSRSYGPFKAVTDDNASADKPEGKLRLVFEKKLRGTVNSPILLGTKYLAFTTTRDRFLIIDREDGSRSARIRKSKGLILNPALRDSLAVIVKRKPLGEVQVINLFNGRIMSSREIKEIRSGPIIIGEALVFGTTYGIAAYSIEDLTPLWRQNEMGMVDTDPYPTETGLFYVSGSRKVVAAAISEGETIWSIDLDNSVTSEISIGRYLYLGLSNGSMIAMDSSNGSIKWQQQLGCEIRGTVVEVEDKIYFGGNDGKVHCLKAESGNKVWDYQTDGVVTASPVVRGRMLIIGSHDRYLYSLDSVTGRLIDRQELQGPVIDAVAVDSNRIFAASGKNRLYCFEAY